MSISYQNRQSLTLSESNHPEGVAFREFLHAISSRLQDYYRQSSRCGTVRSIGLQVAAEPLGYRAKGGRPSPDMVPYSTDEVRGLGQPFVACLPNYQPVSAGFSAGGVVTGKKLKVVWSLRTGVQFFMKTFGKPLPRDIDDRPVPKELLLYLSSMIDSRQAKLKESASIEYENRLNRWYPDVVWLFM